MDVATIASIIAAVCGVIGIRGMCGKFKLLRIVKKPSAKSFGVVEAGTVTIECELRHISQTEYLTGLRMYPTKQIPHVSIARYQGKNFISYVDFSEDISVEPQERLVFSFTFEEPGPSLFAVAIINSSIWRSNVIVCRLD